MEAPNHQEGAQTGLEISDLEPFFLYYFEQNIPDNLKPGRKFTLLPSPKAEGQDFQHLKPAADLARFSAMTAQELKAEKSTLKQLVKIKWLSNPAAAKYTSIGLPNIEEIHEEAYFIGLQSSSYKDYFKYLSTTEGRKVGLRFMTWSQYGEAGEKERAAAREFLEAFAAFEAEAWTYADALIFFYDEMGQKSLKLQLKDGSWISGQGSSMHPGLAFNFQQLLDTAKASSPGDKP